MGLEVIKRECSLKLKIKCIDWLLATRVRKQPVNALILSLRVNRQPIRKTLFGVGPMMGPSDVVIFQGAGPRFSPSGSAHSEQ